MPACTFDSGTRLLKSKAQGMGMLHGLGRAGCRQAVARFHQRESED